MANYFDISNKVKNNLFVVIEYILIVKQFRLYIYQFCPYHPLAPNSQRAPTYILPGFDKIALIQAVVLRYVV